MPQKTDEQQSALKKFRSNFPKVAKPVINAELPNSLAKLSSEKLSDLMNVYTAWREYTEDLLIEALAAFTKCKEYYEFERDKKYLALGKTTNAVKDATLNIDEDLRKYQLPLTDAELYYDLLSNKLESYTNCLTVISREITRRQQVA